MAILSGRVWGDDGRATFEGRVSSGMSIEAILPWEMRRISSFSDFRIGRQWSRGVEDFAVLFREFGCFFVFFLLFLKNEIRESHF